jgi:hypothetical protein
MAKRVDWDDCPGQLANDLVVVLDLVEDDVNALGSGRR